MSLLGDLDTYADELDGERWHNAAKACRDAKAEVTRLRAALDIALQALAMAANRFSDLDRSIWENECWNAHQRVAALADEQEWK
jgi:hypothetical protein